MKRIHAIAVVVAWVLLPVPGFGADIGGGLGGDVEFDSNARRTSTNLQKDVVFRINPYVELREDEGKFNYYLRYRFPWEKAINVQRIEGFRHFVHARAEYNFTDRTALTFSDEFSRSDQVNSISDTQGGISTINTFNEPVNRNNMRLGLSHQFTRRFESTGRVSYRLFDSDLPGRANNSTFGFSLDNRYQLTQRHRVGGGVAVDYQDFDRSNNGARTPSQTLFANVFGSWNWFIDETTTFEIAAGPTFIDTNQDAAPATSIQDAVPFFRRGGGSAPITEGGPIVISDLGSCSTDVIAGTPVQIIPGSNVACQNGAVLGADSYQLFDGTVVRWEDTPYGTNNNADIQGDIDAIIATANSAPLTFSPGTPTSLSDTSWTMFAQASLTKRWTPNLISTATYSRRDSTASGIAGSAVLDLLSLITTWQISELWDSSIRADWTQRESTGPVDQLVLVVDDAAGASVAPTFTTAAFDAGGGGIFGNGIAYNASYSTRRVSQSIDTTRWGIQARIRRRITQNLSSGLRYTFNRQSSRASTAGSFSDFDDHLITLNVQYDFDRWNAW
jgi:hypothetical protein